MKNENTTKVLNKLVEINNGRVKGYKKASENTNENEFRDLFISFKQSSVVFLQELKSEIETIGGEAATGTTTTGKFIRAWRDVESAVSGNDRKAILNSCEKCEEHADDAYRRVLKDELEHLNTRQLSMIQEQHQILKADRSKINKLQSAVEGAEAQ